LDLPFVDGSADVIPDDALWAAVLCLGILASIYRYEEQNDGHDGFYLQLLLFDSLGIGQLNSASQLINIVDDGLDEPETTV
jgi:hypothetical protein